MRSTDVREMRGKAGLIKTPLNMENERLNVARKRFRKNLKCGNFKSLFSRVGLKKCT